MTTWTLVRRNLGRNRVRTILTTLAVAFSSFLVCAVLTLPSVRDAFLESFAGSLRLIVHHKSGPRYLIPLAYVQRVRTVPHVVGVNHMTWFGGIYNDPKDTFADFAIDPETVDEIWPDYDWDPEILEVFKHTRNGALVGVRTMEKFGWQVGDEITIRNGVFPVDLTFKIIGQIPVEEKNIVSTTLWFHRQYLEEAMQPYGGFGLVGMVWVRVDQPEHVNTVIAAIEDLFRNSEAETIAQTEYSYLATFFGSFDGLITVIMFVGVLVVVAVVLIAATTAAMSVRECITDVAVLKTLGFQRRTIFGLLLGEGLFIAGCGGILGSGSAYLLLNAGKSSWSPFFGPLSVFSLSVSVMVQGLFVALLVGLLASMIPTWRAARLEVTRGLREIT